MFDGWRLANSPPQGPAAPSDDEFDAVVSAAQQKGLIDV